MRAFCFSHRPPGLSLLACVVRAAVAQQVALGHSPAAPMRDASAAAQANRHWRQGTRCTCLCGKLPLCTARRASDRLCGCNDITKSRRCKASKKLPIVTGGSRPCLSAAHSRGGASTQLQERRGSCAQRFLLSFRSMSACRASSLMSVLIAFALAFRSELSTCSPASSTSISWIAWRIRSGGMRAQAVQ
jgi:hypothetical protein